MSWADMFWDVDISDEFVKDVFSTMFSIPKVNIEVNQGMADISSSPDYIQISIGLDKFKGDFPSYTEIVILDAALIPNHHHPIFKKISVQYDCRLMLPEGPGLNPYIWTLIENGETKIVKLDPDHLDKDREEIVIVSYL